MTLTMPSTTSIVAANLVTIIAAHWDLVVNSCSALVGNCSAQNVINYANYQDNIASSRIASCALQSCGIDADIGKGAFGSAVNTK